MRTQRFGRRRLALAGAGVAAVLGVWWLAGGAPPPAAPAGESAASPPSMATPPPREMAITPPAPVPAAPVAAASAPPAIQYVGRWLEGPRQVVMLGYRGRSVTVPVPGRVDDRYEVVSANERELVLRDRAAGTTQHVALGAAPSGTAAAVDPQPSTPAPMDASDSLAAPRKLPPPSRRTSDEAEPEN